MRLERAEDDYGGGGGQAAFESDIFQVVRWKRGNGRISTTIECKLGRWLDLRFDGAPTLDSDEACMEQFNCREILQMMAQQKETSFKEGRESKIDEIKKCLGFA